jgi:hypothetical protein
VETEADEVGVVGVGDAEVTGESAIKLVSSVAEDEPGCAGGVVDAVDIASVMVDSVNAVVVMITADGSDCGGRWGAAGASSLPVLPKRSGIDCR